MENIEKKIELNSISQKNMIFCLSCFGSIIIFVLFFIWPEYMVLKEKNLKIKMLKSKVENQKILFPFYNIISAETEKVDRFNDITASPFENKSLPCDTQSVLLDIRNECLTNKLEIKNIKTDLITFDDKLEHLKLEINMQGNFLNLPDFFIKLVKMPCVEYIEYIRVESVYPAKNIEIKFWIAH